MTFYLISTINGHYLGYTIDKKVLETFLKQRKDIQYNIEKIHEDDMTPQLKKSIENSWTELVFSENEMYLFPSEEEYFYEGLDQFLIDVRSYINSIKNKLKYLKINNVEMFKIIEMIKTFSDIIDKIDETFSSGDYNYSDYLNIERMVNYIISVLN